MARPGQKGRRWRVTPPPNGKMILRQTLHIEPVVAASYLFGCGSKQAAAVVDPVGDPRSYLQQAAELGMDIKWVVDTHVHADHISTGPDLATAANAPYVLHESVSAAFKPMSTIGFERRFNKAFAIEDRNGFVEAMLRDIPRPPPNASANRAANLGKALVAE